MPEVIRNKEGCIDKEKLDHDLEIWKVAMETQMHFNELLIKMRTTVISIILAVFGVSAIVIRDIKYPVVDLFHKKVHVSSIVLTIGVVFLFCQYIIDSRYYLKLLLGAVDFTRKIDDDYEDKDNRKFVFGLTKSITNRISEGAAKNVLSIYYFIPIALSICVIYLIQTHINILAMLNTSTK